MKERLIYVVIIMVLSVLLALSWGKKPDVVSNNTHTTDTVVVTINNTDTIYMPKPFRVIEKVIEKHRDTVYIYNDYYKTVEYRDTIRDKNSASNVYLYDIVTQNRLSRRYVDFYSSDISITKTNTVVEYRNRANFYLGVSATTRGNIFLDATYKTPNKGMYSLGYDPIDKALMLGIKFKIY